MRFFCIVAVVSSATFREEKVLEEVEKDIVAEDEVASKVGIELSDEDFASLVEELDTDKDGTLSMPEFKAKLESDFKSEYDLDALPTAIGSLVEEMDMNKNDVVDKDELATLLSGMEAALEKSGLGPEHFERMEAEKALDEEYASLLEKVDTDKDGKLSMEEVLIRMKSDMKEEYNEDAVPEYVASLVQKGDTNQNGFIDKDEIMGLRDDLTVEMEKEGHGVNDKVVSTAEEEGDEEGSPQTDSAAEEYARLLEQVDTDKDGKLSMEEVLTRMKDDFKDEYSLDTVPARIVSLLENGDVNQNGFIEESEIPGIRAGMEVALEAEGLVEVGGVKDEEQEPEADSLLEDEKVERDFSALLQKVDTNQDGKASMEEVQTRMAKDFVDEYDIHATPAEIVSLIDEGDVDKSGFIEKEEVSAIAENLEHTMQVLELDEQNAARLAALAETEVEDPEPEELAFPGDFTEEDYKLFVEGVDADKDGHLSLAELSNAMEEDFQDEYEQSIPAEVKNLVVESDSNGDGEIDRDELTHILTNLEKHMSLAEAGSASTNDDVEEVD